MDSLRGEGAALAMAAPERAVSWCCSGVARRLDSSTTRFPSPDWDSRVPLRCLSFASTARPRRFGYGHAGPGPRLHRHVL